MGEASRVTLAERRAALRAYLLHRGPATRARILADTGIPPGSLSHLLAAGGFVSARHGVWSAAGVTAMGEDVLTAPDGARTLLPRGPRYTDPATVWDRLERVRSKRAVDCGVFYPADAEAVLAEVARLRAWVADLTAALGGGHG